MEVRPERRAPYVSCVDQETGYESGINPSRGSIEGRRRDEPEQEEARRPLRCEKLTGARRMKSARQLEYTLDGL